MTQYRKRLDVQPHERLPREHVEEIHHASLALLDDPGVWCGSERVAAVFESGGCMVTRDKHGGKDDGWRVRIPESVVKRVLESAPQQVTLGARDPENSLLLDGKEPGSYFGTGSETNVFLDSALERFVSTGDSGASAMLPVFTERQGSIAGLCRSAHLIEQLPNVDFFIRNVNIQDEAIEPGTKDVNVFFASLMHTTKHVQGGVENIDALGDVLRLARLAAEDGAEGDADDPRRLPLSFIACPVKSPLQMVTDTSEKVVTFAGERVPLVLSSSPQGGSTAPIQEEGIVAQINAEIIAGIALAQLSNPGTPVLYGAVPVRARLDNLHDFYGAPEFIHYNLDCVQMARYYGIPCYSTAGVGDAKRPGIQAMVEKLPAYLSMGSSGANYIHYAFGLLDRTNIFSPLQAVMDDAAVGFVKDILRPCGFTDQDVVKAVSEIRTVAESGGIFARRVRRQLRRGVVSDAFGLAGDETDDGVLQKAQEKLDAIEGQEGRRLSAETVEKIYQSVPGLVDRRYFHRENGGESA